MRSSKQILNVKQQKIKEILQDEKQNGNDLTKKELIDQIRHILEQDYVQNEYQKERRLREEEIRRIRKLRRDGKITAEEEEYLIQSANKNDVSKFKSEIKAEENKEKSLFYQDFQLNPTFSTKITYFSNARKNEKKHSSNENSKENNHKDMKKERIEYSTISKEEKELEIAETGETKGSDFTANENEIKPIENHETSENKDLEENKDSKENKVKEENKENDDDVKLTRELSEMTSTLINESDLDKLYEIAERMVFISSKK